MKKIKISLYLALAQMKLLDEIKKELRQKRSLVLREAVNCYLSLYQKSKRINSK